VSNYGSGTIGEYDLDGTPVNPAFISGLQAPTGLAFGPNGDLFVEDMYYGTVLEYTASGTQVNGALISHLNDPMSLVVVPEPSTAALGALSFVLLTLAGFRSRVG
jgi:hypothetical protein